MRHYSQARHARFRRTTLRVFVRFLWFLCRWKAVDLIFSKSIYITILWIRDLCEKSGWDLFIFLKMTQKWKFSGLWGQLREIWSDSSDFFSIDTFGSSSFKKIYTLLWSEFCKYAKKVDESCWNSNVFDETWINHLVLHSI